MAETVPLNALGLIIDGDFAGLTVYTRHDLRKVFFPVAPPTKPPSDLQLAQRRRFAAATAAWSRLDPLERRRWEATTNSLIICSTGIGLWISLCLRGEPQLTDTILHQSPYQLSRPPDLSQAQPETANPSSNPLYGRERPLETTPAQHEA